MVVEISEGQLEWYKNELKRETRRKKALERHKYQLLSQCRFRVGETCHADEGRKCIGQCLWNTVDFDENEFLVIPDDRR